MRSDPVRAEVVRFWATIERFNPQPVPKLRRHVVDIAPDRPLPWDPAEVERRGPPRKGTVWRHAVYLGLFQVADVDRLLDDAFGVEGTKRRGRTMRSALAAIDVSAEGVAIADSIVVSSCAWAAGRLLDPGPGDPTWLRGFEQDERWLKQSLVGCLPLPRVDVAPVGDAAEPLPSRLTWATLAAMRDELTSGVGVSGVIPCSPIRVETMEVKRRRIGRPDGHDFLNSFIANDLRTVAGHVDASEYGQALADYLRHDDEIDREARTDVRERLDEVRRQIAPGRIPLGRWPSAVDRPLAMGQQLGVNGVWGALRDQAGLFAVNGPPGTGKTTMLRDLVAAIVVERARVLSLLDNPRAAFDRQGAWSPALTGFEIVVASSNNAAVQNVVDELPTAGAVDARWPRDAPELVEVAEALLRIRRDEEDGDDEEALGAPGDGGRRDSAAAWALIAARLGRMEHRHDFVKRFWYGDREETSEGRRPATKRMEAILSDLRDPCRSRPWPDAVAQFTAAWRRAEAAAGERVKLDELIDALERAEQEARRCAEQADSIERVRADRARNLAAADATYAERYRDVNAAMRAEHAHDGARPRRFGVALPLGEPARRWRAERERLRQETVRRRAERDAARQDVAEHHRVVVELAERIESLRERERAALASAEPLRQARTDGQRRWGSAVPAPTWWTSADERERIALWNDEAWNEARSELFLAALRLHRDFLAVAPLAFDDSLRLAISIVAGDVSSHVAPRKALTAWRSLFFVVPVVSTTFASLGRLFTHLGTESLGWLLIDEAGQAVPQNAIGAIWRSRRVVVVGDPMQLEPVVTLSERAQQAIRAGHHVDERWLPGRTSVQRLADELTSVGTSISSAAGEVWVGSPLRVHRRCDEPMFSVVNEIAYDGQMIDGVAPRELIGLPPSHWVDVRGWSREGNSIAEEHRAVRRILVALEGEYGLDLASVFLISPFRDVAREFAHLPHLDRTKMEGGTAHRSQGKERDVVILVLGGTEGARWWAADKPNLLNVAVSRARRRLYVVGDRESWKRRRSFDVLARSLPTNDPW